MISKVRIIASIILSIAILLLFMIIRSFIVQYCRLDILLKGNNVVKIEVFDDYTEAGFILSADKDNLTQKVKIENNIDNTKVGEYEVKYSLDLSDRHIEKIRKVQVVDTTPPVLKVDSSQDIYTVKGIELKTPKCSAVDNYDEDITKKIEVSSNVDYNKVGIYQIDYKVKDLSGNEAKETINVHVEETKKAYIEVAIKKQKLYYYEFDKLVLESDVVTGYADATPYGTFKVIYKARNVYLRGRDYVSFVEYWIDFKDHAYGFHDASWRNKFGGQIYLTNGSHGCVNMPKDKVKELYSLVSIGTPVYIHS